MLFRSVSTVNASAGLWDTVFTAVGSVTAVQGVTMTAETPGKVVRIDFDSGDLCQSTEGAA